MTDTTQPGADNALDLDKLEALARAATPGPWYGDRFDGTVKYTLLGGDHEPVIRGDNGNSSAGPFGIDKEEDEKYLLAFHPAAVLALIALARRAAQPVEPVAYVNGDELDNMLDDRTALIQTAQTGYRATPLYRAATHPSEPAVPAVGAPVDCSGDPSCCPENEGYGCHCSPVAPAGALVASDDVMARELARAASSPVRINDAELAAFHRFCDCCEDFDAGGHDVEKTMMSQLVRIGLLRPAGPGRHETTKFGDWLRRIGLRQLARCRPI